MKAALVSMNVRPGECERNFIYMKDKIEAAKEQGADLIVFPQNAVSGYLLGDVWLDREFCKLADSYNQRILELADDIAIVWGNVKYRHGMLFNCAFFAYQGQTHMRVKKNDDALFYQDSRYFQVSEINSAIEYKDMTFALNFKDDIQLADFNINLDASSWYVDKQPVYRGNQIYVNTLGVQNCGKNFVVYDGEVHVNFGKNVLYQGDCFHEGMKIVDLDTNSPAVIPDRKTSLLQVMDYAIREIDDQLFQGKISWIVGLSGGLDSSVTAALLTHALGKNRVIGFNMASKHNSDKTISNAEKLAQALDIPCHNGSIEKLVNSSVEVLKDYGYDDANWNSLVKENIQARLRGHLLSSFASIHGGVIVNNGNKVEVALGYCTLYGDAVGALGIIGDLSKVQLFSLSREINEDYGKEVIPTRLLPDVSDDIIDWEMPPSAELKDDQYDPMKWFYHDYLVEHLRLDLSFESLMEQYLDDKLISHPLGRWITYYHLDEPQAFIDDLEWFKHTMMRNGFKRVQLPPLLVLSRNPYGNGYVESQMVKDEIRYQELKEAILRMDS